MRYNKPSGVDLLISVISWAIIGVIVCTVLGLFLGSAGLIIGPIAGLLLGLAQAGRSFSEKEKQYEETQKFVMQKVQTGTPLSKEEQTLWDTMNQIEHPTGADAKDSREVIAKKHYEFTKEQAKQARIERRVDEFGSVPEHCFSKFDRLRSKHLLWLDMADYIKPGKRKEKYLRKAQSYLDKARIINQKRIEKT